MAKDSSDELLSLIVKLGAPHLAHLAAAAFVVTVGIWLAPQAVRLPEPLHQLGVVVGAGFLAGGGLYFLVALSKVICRCWKER